ncbi:Putative ribonuclease H protein At1g65750 [Linum perenne]
MKQPSPGSGKDDLIWGPDPKGWFSIKFAYEVLSSTSKGINESLWKTVWDWQGPNRVRFFLWLATHNRLLTNGERKRRHLPDDDRCHFCKDEVEDSIHVLRAYQFARKLWINILPLDHITTFFTGTLSDSLLRELKHPDFGQLVGIAAWLLWKARNETIFEK